MSGRRYPRNTVATDEQICAFIDEFRMAHGYSPTIREICGNFGYKSPSTVKYRLDAMRRMGMVRFEPDMPRTIMTTGSDAPWR